MPNPKIEDLRKKSFLLYSGPKGPELVNKEIKKFGIKEEELNEYQLRVLLNNIIKVVFVDYVGLEATKIALDQDVTHVTGYHTNIEEENEQIHINERFPFMRGLAVALALVTIVVVSAIAYYFLMFNKDRVCGTIRDADGRDACFLSLAITRGNISFCDSMNGSVRIYNCYDVVGKKLNRTNICERIPGDDINLINLHDNCKMCVAVALRNKSLCSDFLNQITESECLSQVEHGIALNC